MVIYYFSALAILAGILIFAVVYMFHSRAKKLK